tara:strand:- start:80 stop:487 length:408 start_codon:yes stop_codon:yes gene_type:complete
MAPMKSIKIFLLIATSLSLLLLAETPHSAWASQGLLDCKSKVIQFELWFNGSKPPQEFSSYKNHEALGTPQTYCIQDWVQNESKITFKASPCEDGSILLGFEMQSTFPGVYEGSLFAFLSDSSVLSDSELTCQFK